MNFKKIFFIFFVIIYSRSFSKSKKNNENLKQTNNNNLSHIKQIFGKYFNNIDTIVKNEKEMLKKLINESDITFLDKDDITLLIIWRSLIPSFNTMYTEIMQLATTSKKNENNKEEINNKEMILKKIEDLVLEYTFQIYIETIKQYIESKKNNNKEYKALIKNIENQINIFIKTFLYHQEN